MRGSATGSNLPRRSIGRKFFPPIIYRKACSIVLSIPFPLAWFLRKEADGIGVLASISNEPPVRRWLCSEN